MILSHIVARSENGVIGLNGKLPWHIPEDLKFFKKTTLNHILIMGRKTFESLPHPLPNRFHIVITRNPNYKIQHPQVQIALNIEEALKIAETRTQSPDEEVFIIGGGDIFQQTLSLAQKLYITEVHKTIEGDTFYPTLDPHAYQTFWTEDHKGTPHFTFTILSKI